MVYAFNTVYAGVIKGGVLITPEPAQFVWSEKRDAWYNRKLDLEIEWLGHVAGDPSYLSSRHIEEVEEWIRENS
jgi:hypothetical protein